MRNRYYDPASGRFTQEDPIGLAGGMNLYGYAEGDPANFSDPFGLRTCCTEEERREIFSNVAQQTAGVKWLVEGIGKLVGLKSLADGAVDIGAGNYVAGGIKIALALPFGKLGNTAKLAASERPLGEAIAGAGIRKAIAGAGTKELLRDVDRLVAQYGGEAGDWAKMVGETKKVDGVALQIHWYENIKTGFRTEFKHNLPK